MSAFLMGVLVGACIVGSVAGFVLAGAAILGGAIGAMVGFAGLAVVLSLINEASQ